MRVDEYTFKEPEPDLHNSFSKSGDKTTQTVHANKRSSFLVKSPHNDAMCVS